MKKVSIITPCYNQGKYLSETLDSVLAQSYTNWECIIVDDGSIDDTEKVARRYCKKDERFKYLKQENDGPSMARNKGILNSSGDYILPVDSDDLISENYVREAVSVLDSDSKIKLVYCQAALFGERTGPWLLPGYLYEKLLYENMIFCSAMYRRSDYDRTNGYNSNMREGLEDWDFWLSLIEKKDVVFQIPEIHFYYRIKVGSRNDGLNVDNDNIKKLYRQIYVNHKKLYENDINPIYSNFKLRRMEQLIQEKDKIIKIYRENLEKRDDELRSIKSSVIWKSRNVFFGIRFMLLHPVNFLRKYSKYFKI